GHDLDDLQGRAASEVAVHAPQSVLTESGRFATVVVVVHLTHGEAGLTERLAGQHAVAEVGFEQDGAATVGQGRAQVFEPADLDGARERAPAPRRPGHPPEPHELTVDPALPNGGPR